MPHPPLPAIHTAIILTNLGTPAAPTTACVRAYLREFLSDRRVVEIHPLVWQVLLNTLVLPLRSKRSARLYQAIWQADGSPLLTHSEQVCTQLNARIQQENPNTRVFLGMRYGTPSLNDLLAEVSRMALRRLIILPMYPQYASATTGSTFELTYQHLQRARYQPSLHTLHSYHDHPAYIQALADSVRHSFAETGAAFLVISFHGIPQRSLALGDPYACLCQKTGRLLAEALNLKNDAYRVVFQSRFGKAQWLQPYCDKTLAALPAEGIDKVAVICPGFAVDCLETLEEIAIQNQRVFLAAGGRSYNYIPCLNASEAQIALYHDLLKPLLA